MIADPKAVNLCSVEIMKYYPQFPTAIPHLRARSIIFLTLPPLTLAGPFDLHALTMPPAFSLSQNQTLHLIFCEPYWPCDQHDLVQNEDLKPVETTIARGRSDRKAQAPLSIRHH